MRYRNLDIRIRSTAGTAFEVEMCGPNGWADAAFEPPVAVADIAALAERFERDVRRSGGRDVHPTAGGLTPASDPQRHLDLLDLGAQLFAALFAGELRYRLLEILSFLSGRDGQEGVRLRLFLDPADDRAAVLAALPWELMLDPRTRSHLGLQPHTPIVRYLPVLRTRLEPFVGQVRVLVVSAQPGDLTNLDLVEEWQRIWAALRGRPALVEPLVRPSFAHLHEVMSNGRFHVLHFMGHGSFDRNLGSGALIFEQDGRSEPVEAGSLAVLLRAQKDLRLVVLNACGSGAVARRRAQAPLSGVAAALVLAGLPAVVAMQFPISDQAAIIFGATLYERLAAADPVEAAVAAGRRAVMAAAQGSLEWATPVLFQCDAGDETFVAEALGQDEVRDVAGLYVIEDGNPTLASLQQLLAERYAFRRGSLVGAGICWSDTYLGMYRNTQDGTWGILRGHLFHREGMSVQALATDGSVLADKVAWRRHKPVATKPITPGPPTRYAIGHDRSNLVEITSLGDELLALQCSTWIGIGMLHKDHYLGVYRYTHGADYAGVWGCHEGTREPDGTLSIHGTSLIRIGGVFDLTWIPLDLA